jgi:D-alanyl-D-alanine endopeptidase (penicillin-binding protein 7)
MVKLALGALISLLFILTPASAAKVEGGAQAAKVKKHIVKKAGVKRRLQAHVAKVHHPRVVRQVGVVRGKRVVTYRNVRNAHALVAARSAGDVAGLNLTRDPLALASSVALVLDQSSSEILFEKNANVALPIASITKLMTGLVVVLAQQDMHEVLAVTEADVDYEKHTSSRLRVGARMSRGDLLHIALMSSENRAASALGRNYPGGIAAFVAAMNAKALALGMLDTHFVDSSGLSRRNVASARDLAKLAMVAHQEPLLREYSTDPNYQVDAGGRVMHYSNTNYLVASPDWQIGLQKTGVINEAGRCLVMQAMIQGRAVIMVFLDSKGKQSRTADAGRLERFEPAAHAAGVG